MERCSPLLSSPPQKKATSLPLENYFSPSTPKTPAASPRAAAPGRTLRRVLFLCVLPSLLTAVLILAALIVIVFVSDRPQNFSSGSFFFSDNCCSSSSSSSSSTVRDAITIISADSASLSNEPACQHPSSSHMARLRRLVYAFPRSPNISVGGGRNLGASTHSSDIVAVPTIAESIRNASNELFLVLSGGDLHDRPSSPFNKMYSKGLVKAPAASSDSSLPKHSESAGRGDADTAMGTVDTPHNTDNDRFLSHTLEQLGHFVQIPIGVAHDYALKSTNFVPIAGNKGASDEGPMRTSQSVTVTATDRKAHFPFYGVDHVDEATRMMLAMDAETPPRVSVEEWGLNSTASGSGGSLLDPIDIFGVSLSRRSDSGAADGGSLKSSLERRRRMRAARYRRPEDADELAAKGSIWHTLATKYKNMPLRPQKTDDNSIRPHLIGEHDTDFYCLLSAVYFENCWYLDESFEGCVMRYGPLKFEFAMFERCRTGNYWQSMRRRLLNREASQPISGAGGGASVLKQTESTFVPIDPFFILPPQIAPRYLRRSNEEERVGPKTKAGRHLRTIQTYFYNVSYKTEPSNPRPVRSVAKVHRQIGSSSFAAPKSPSSSSSTPSSMFAHRTDLYPDAGRALNMGGIYNAEVCRANVDIPVVNPSSSSSAPSSLFSSSSPSHPPFAASFSSDGEDESGYHLKLPPMGPPRHCSNGALHYPLHFGMPRVNIHKRLLPKLWDMSPIPLDDVPVVDIIAEEGQQGGTGAEKRTRQRIRKSQKLFGPADEDLMRTILAMSHFCLTHSRHGWDCGRHSEVLGAGCIPFFFDIHAAGPFMLPHLPKKFLMDVAAMPLFSHLGPVVGANGDRYHYPKRTFSDVRSVGSRSNSTALTAKTKGEGPERVYPSFFSPSEPFIHTNPLSYEEAIHKHSELTEAQRKQLVYLPTTINYRDRVYFVGEPFGFHPDTVVVSSSTSSQAALRHLPPPSPAITFDKDWYWLHARKLLKYSQQHTSAESMAGYIIDTMLRPTRVAEEDQRQRVRQSGSSSAGTADHRTSGDLSPSSTPIKHVLVVGRPGWDNMHHTVVAGLMGLGISVTVVTGNNPYPTVSFSTPARTVREAYGCFVEPKVRLTTVENSAEATTTMENTDGGKGSSSISSDASLGVRRHTVPRKMSIRELSEARERASRYGGAVYAFGIPLANRIQNQDISDDEHVLDADEDVGGGEDRVDGSGGSSNDGHRKGDGGKHERRKKKRHVPKLTFGDSIHHALGMVRSGAFDAAIYTYYYSPEMPLMEFLEVKHGVKGRVAVIDAADTLEDVRVSSDVMAKEAFYFSRELRDATC